MFSFRVDYQSMYKHPYMTDPVDLPFYHIDCSVIWTYNIIKRRQFNDMFNHFTWISRVEEDGHPYIVDMLTSRTSSNGEVIEYRDTPFDKHVFIHNTMKHVNSPLSVHLICEYMYIISISIFLIFNIILLCFA